MWDHFLTGFVMLCFVFRSVYIEFDGRKNLSVSCHFASVKNLPHRALISSHFPIAHMGTIYIHVGGSSLQKNLEVEVRDLGAWTQGPVKLWHLGQNKWPKSLDSVRPRTLKQNMKEVFDLLTDCKSQMNWVGELLLHLSVRGRVLSRIIDYVVIYPIAVTCRSYGSPALSLNLLTHVFNCLLDLGHIHIE